MRFVLFFWCLINLHITMNKVNIIGRGRNERIKRVEGKKNGLKEERMEG